MGALVLLSAPEVPLFAVSIATVFGAGLIDPLRAFLAVTLSAPLAFWIQHSDNKARAVIVLVAIVLAGGWAATAWISVTGSSDDREIVIDEVAGFILAAFIGRRLSLVMIVALVPVFLALDRWKPWPLSSVEHLPGSIGIMGDDLAAGLILGLIIYNVRRMIDRTA
jgi:phosphatidylglycerophosphatase A